MYMEIKYRVVGVKSIDGGYKKLELQSLDRLVSESSEVNAMDILKNISSFTKDTMKRMQKFSGVDVICIPDDVYVEKNIELDGLFTIKVI